jgi:exosortase A-associated hydrolase 1
MNDSAPIEEVITFDSAQARLLGIVSRPAPGRASDTAVLIVVGGPQYRVGSHRQFVSLARALATAGYPTLRFDLTGMGDSPGDPVAFDACGSDVRSAIDALLRACPDTSRVVVWGLCDGASAALMFAGDDPRVAGMIAANPWARSEASLATTRLKHYYTARLLQREFWAKLLGGGLQWRASLRSLLGSLRGTRRGAAVRVEGGSHEPFQTRMARGLARFKGRVLLILSGNDLTAKEFIEFTRASPDWGGLLQRPAVSRFELSEADHTFSRHEWLLRVQAESIAWLDALRGQILAAPAGAAAERRSS